MPLHSTVTLRLACQRPCCSHNAVLDQSDQAFSLESDRHLPPDAVGRHHDIPGLSPSDTLVCYLGTTLQAVLELFRDDLPCLYQVRHT